MAKDFRELAYGNDPAYLEALEASYREVAAAVKQGPEAALAAFQDMAQRDAAVFFADAMSLANTMPPEAKDEIANLHRLNATVGSSGAVQMSEFTYRHGATLQDSIQHVQGQEKQADAREQGNWDDFAAAADAAKPRRETKLFADAVRNPNDPGQRSGSFADKARAAAPDNPGQRSR